MSPEMLTALLKAHQTGAVPLEVFFDLLQKGEIVSPDMDFGRYEAMVNEGMSMMTGLGTEQPQQGNDNEPDPDEDEQDADPPQE
jgi:hypothetical protein